MCRYMYEQAYCLWLVFESHDLGIECAGVGRYVAYIANIHSVLTLAVVSVELLVPQNIYFARMPMLDVLISWVSFR